MMRYLQSDSGLLVPRQEILAPRSRQRGFFTMGAAFVGNSSSASPSDLYFSYVVSLMHFEGPNDSTTFTDQVPANVWVANVGATISTAQAKFGLSCGLFPRNVVAPIGLSSGESTSSFQLGTADFTLEGWFYPLADSSGGYGFMYAKGLNGSNGVSMSVTSTNVLIRTGGNPDYSAAVVISGWTHIAWVRVSGTVTIYVNGEAVLSETISFDNSDTGEVFIGSNPGNPNDGIFSYSGYIDEFRLTNGVARYTSNFATPTTAFPNS